MQTDAREQMITHQVRAWDVLDERVLDTLRKIPREPFVPPEYRFLANADLEVRLPGGRHMLRPSVVGRLLQALRLSGTDRVFEVGTGSGFVTACLRAASATVQSIEILPELADMARRTVTTLGMRNIDILTEDAMKYEPQSRFDAIAVTASVPVYDPRFQNQLAVGGRLFIVVGEAPVMEARLVRRLSEDAWTSESLFETVIDPLIDATRPEEFTF